MSNRWKVLLEVDSLLKPTELAVYVNMIPGVKDARIERANAVNIIEGEE